MSAPRPGHSLGGDPEPQVEVTLQLATHPVLATPLERTLVLPRTATILDLKHRIRHEWDGTPLEDGVTVTKGARVLRDQESLDAAFEEELAATPTPPLVLNVIVRPSAWSTPFTSAAPSRPSSPDLFHDAPLPRQTTPPPRAATDSPAPSSAAAVAGSPARSVGSAYTPGFFDSAVAAGAASTSSPAVPAPLLVSPTPSGSGTRTASASAIMGAAGPYVTYLAHLQRLVPLQRALLLLNLQKAHAHYANMVATGDGDALVEVEALLRGVGLWESVEERVRAAEKEAAEAHAPALEEEFRVIQIGGLPYLLHTPPALLAQAPSPPSPSLLRVRAIHAHLTTMLQLLVTLAPAAPSIAHGRTVAGRPTPAAVAAAQQVLARAGAAPAALGHGAHGDVVGAVQQGQQQRRRATLSVIINLEAVFSILVPLVLLSVKLGFLLWLFGRNATPRKRLALGAIAVLWIAFEGWGILRRRQAQGRERDRAERERRRAARAQGRAQQGAGAAGAGLAAGGGGGQAAPAAQGAAAGADAARPGAAPAARATRRRVPASRLSPKYWLNTLAAVGLVAEARELGLQPRYIAGRPVAPPSPHPPGPVRRALRNILVATVLFVATLSPEVERKRRRALDKRERLLAERRARDGRDRVAQAQQRLRVQQGALHRAPSGVEVALTSEDDDSRQPSRAGTPGPGARAHPLRHEIGPSATAAAERERAGEGEGAGDGETSAGERLEMDAAGLRKRRMAALAQREQGAGRARVSDVELFRDGGSEAYSSARAGASGSGSGPQTGSSSAQLGDEARTTTLPPPVTAAPQVPALAPVALAAAAAEAEDADEREVDPEEEDVASASGDGASTSGDEVGPADGEQGRRIRAAGAEGDEVDEVVALF
ncbi:hypothetical protein JCM8208_005879 [Rhodotorula glutinis]